MPKNIEPDCGSPARLQLNQFLMGAELGFLNHWNCVGPGPRTKAPGSDQDRAKARRLDEFVIAGNAKWKISKRIECKYRQQVGSCNCLLGMGTIKLETFE